MAFSHLSRTLSLALVTLALSATACADVGGGSPSSADTEFPVVKSTDNDVIVCQSIRSAIQKDLKAAKEADAAGDKKAAASHREAVQAGVSGASTVKGCDTTDLVPATGATPSPS